MITQQCGFMALIQERCQLFRRAHFTIFRDKLINNLVDLGKFSSSSSSSHQITGLPQDTTLISTILRQESHSISCRTLEMGRLAALKDSLSRHRFGLMATSHDILVVMSAKVTFHDLWNRWLADRSLHLEAVSRLVLIISWCNLGLWMLILC